MTTGEIQVRIYPIPALVGLAPTTHQLQAAGVILVQIGHGVSPSVVTLTPAAHELQASGSVEARILARPAVELTPAAHALQATGNVPVRVFPRPLDMRLVAQPRAPVQATGAIRVQVNPAVRRSYVAALRQDAVERLSRLSQFRRVFDSRQAQITRGMLPALRVYTSQSALGRSINIPDFLTTTTLVVQVIAEDITDAASADRVDQLCDDVKDWLLGDPEFLVNYEQATSIATEIERDIEGESRLTVATLSFGLTISEYYEPRIPDTLEEIHMEIDVITPAADPNLRYPGPDGRIEATANFLKPLPPRRGAQSPTPPSRRN